VLTNSQAEALAREHEAPPEVKEEPDPELAIPKTSVLNYQTTIKQTGQPGQMKRAYRGGNRG
jgi:hypothetical protein